MPGRRQRKGSFAELDSFMDIVTNVIGALFFVLVYVALASGGARGKVTLPMIEPADTEAVFFECRADTVLFPDVDSLTDQVTNILGRAVAEAGEGKVDINDLQKELEEADIHNAYYKHECSVIHLLLGQLQSFAMVPDAKGEHGHEIQSQGSEFRKKLAKLDPAKHHVFFIVRTDSFNVFHSARRLAVDQGFRVGWGPISAEGNLTFGSGGEETKPQG